VAIAPAALTPAARRQAAAKPSKNAEDAAAWIACPTPGRPADGTDASPAPEADHPDPQHRAQSTVRSNARLEGLNSRVRLISHRSFGFHSAAPLIALIYLCCGGIVIDLPVK
jgi:Transposase